MLAALDAAAADARRRRVRPAGEALHLVGPNATIIGATGRRVGVSGDGRSMWAFTLTQVEQMSERLREAIREEAGLPPVTDRRRR